MIGGRLITTDPFICGYWAHNAAENNSATKRRRTEIGAEDHPSASDGAAHVFTWPVAIQMKWMARQANVCVAEREKRVNHAGAAQAGCSSVKWCDVTCVRSAVRSSGDNVPTRRRSFITELQVKVFHVFPVVNEITWPLHLVSVREFCHCVSGS